LSKILVIAAGGLIGARVVFSLANKLMGQVNVVRYGMKSVRPSGAMTLTTGLAAQYTSPGSAIITTVNAAVELSCAQRRRSRRKARRWI
jgi:uncharacterized protein YbjT (DUF2867 family)